MRALSHLLAIFFIALLSTRAVGQGTVLISNFEDGTLQGWNLDSSAGYLTVSAPGSDGHGSALDIFRTPDWVDLMVRIPVSGDLSSYSGIVWDEFVPDHGTLAAYGPGLYVIGTDGTFFGFAPRPQVLGVDGWSTRFLPFESAHYYPWRGAASFDEVIRNVDSIFISGGTGLVGSQPLQLRIDNVYLVPEPSKLTLSFVALATFFAFGDARQKRKNRLRAAGQPTGGLKPVAHANRGSGGSYGVGGLTRGRIGYSAI